MRISHCCAWFLTGLLATSCVALAGDSQPIPSAKSDAWLYLKVQLDEKLKTSALRPGDVVNGKLARPVYSADREVFASGSQVQLTVDKVEKRRREPNDHWPWVIKAFMPRHENFPSFHASSVLGSNGISTPLQVSLVSINRERSVQAQSRKGVAGEAVPSSSALARDHSPTSKVTTDKIATLLAALPESQANAAPPTLTGPVTLESGTHAKIILLGPVSAGKSRPGDTFQARIVEPVRVNDVVVLPEGSVLEGEVVKSTPPRWLSRGGSLYLKFNKLFVPGGGTAPITATLTGVEINERSHTKVDAEGGLRADRPGKAWLLANIGVTAGLAKVTDDTTQLIIEAIVSTATDASTAGSAKIAAACVSGVFLLTRHGRDVVIPQFTEMDVMFDRPASLPAQEEALRNSAPVEHQALPQPSSDSKDFLTDKRPSSGGHLADRW
jgi:hypothetical protein